MRGLRYTPAAVKTNPTITRILRRPLTGVAIAAALGASTVVGPVHAAQPTKLALERYERLTEEGQTAYQAGRFEDAIRLYLLAFDAVPDPSILYNIGFIYEKKLDDPELAMGYYERVATAVDSPPELIAKANNRLEIARQLAAEKKGRPTEPVDVKPPDGGEKPPVDPPNTGRSLNVAPVVTAAVGGAALLAGAIFGSLAVETQVRFAQAREDGLADRARDLQKTGRNQALLGDALMIGGGTVAAVGLIWFLVDGWSEPSTSSSVQIHASPIADGAVVLIGGSL